MASDDVKQFLLTHTGVPGQRWKRLSRTKAANGALIRLFEDRETGRRVLTSELNRTFSVVADSAQDGGASPEDVATVALSHSTGGPDPSLARRFAIVLAEDPSFDDALDELLEDQPDVDLSYRWLTTLLIGGPLARSPRHAVAALRRALPAYEVAEPGDDTGLMVFDDAYFVQKRDSGFGLCTCEADRLDVMRALEADGWTFDLTLGNGYAYGVGRPVPEEPVGPIVAWFPGMPLPTPEGDAPGWRERAQTIVDAIPDMNGQITHATQQELREHLKHEHSPVLRELLMAMLGQQGGGMGPVGRGAAPTPQAPHPAEAPTAAAPARFSFSFGENGELDGSDWQREWLEIYDAQDEGADRHVTEPMAEVGIQVPVGLTEAVEGVFDYKLGQPAWDRRELAQVLLALGLDWNREGCVLAATGFDPNQLPPTAPWWRP